MSLKGKQTVVSSYNGVLFGNKKWILTHTDGTSKCYAKELTELRQSQRTPIFWFHLYEMSRIGKSVKTESGAVVP